MVTTTTSSAPYWAATSSSPARTRSGPPTIARWPGGAEGPQARAALAAVSMLLSDLAVPEPGEGAGRRVLVVHEPGPLGELDGQVIGEMLENQGWVVSELTADELDSARTVADLRPAAIVLTGGGTEGAERARRTAGQSAGAPHVTQWSLADADAGTVAGLASELAAALRTQGPVAWGLGLRREGDVLSIALTGHLDSGALHRFEEVVASRTRSFARLELDLGDVSSAEAGVISTIGDRARAEGWDVRRMRRDGDPPDAA